MGWLNGWSTTDKSYPLTLSSDEKSWAITVPANGDDGWFKIAPASAYSSDNFWHYLLNASYDGCRELSGEMVYGEGGAWLLPNSDGITHYTITIVPSTMQFVITPVSGETPQPQPEPEHDWSGTLPVLFINTEAPVTSKETYVSGSYYLDNQGLEDYESIGSADAPLPLQIKGRGNYTWTGFDKKPYRLKLDAKAKPLGMKSSKHFTLLAHADDNLAFLRNTVGFELSRRLGLAYTPEQRPVEVVLNGDYIGLYMMTEQIRVDANRVNIVEQNDGETNPENITGGWLLEIDNYDDDCQIRMTEGNGALLRCTYHSPEVLSDEQKNYLTQYLQAADDAIYNSDKNSTLWEDYIDMEALVAFYIVQEMMDNGESFHGSCYLHKDRGENTKLVFGPVWDFGNSFSRQQSLNVGCHSLPTTMPPLATLSMLLLIRYQLLPLAMESVGRNIAKAISRIVATSSRTISLRKPLSFATNGARLRESVLRLILVTMTTALQSIRLTVVVCLLVLYRFRRVSTFITIVRWWSSNFHCISTSLNSP